MSGVLPFIPKENSDIPDYYGMKILYVNGKIEEIDGSHTIIKDTSTVEILSKDDVFSFVPISSIQRIEFDKRFSTIVSLRNKNK